MAQVGQSKSLLSQITAQTVDPQGNQIISSDTSFGASPAGQALLTQQLFGLANATFNLTPPDIFTTIGGENQVPYWRFYESSDGVMAGTALYDDTADTWGIKLTPGTAASGDFMSFSTRSYLVNDDNLSLRQKLLTVISKTGTAGGTASQWNMTLSAIYYGANDTALSTAYIGTVYDTGTWTSMSGTTTPGGSAINAAARYVDFEYLLTATAAVTGSAAVTIKSCLLSTKIGANSSFVIAETFTSSSTFTVPTGVTTVAVALMGAGGGGGGGGVAYNTTSLVGGGGGGGGGGGFVFAPYVAVTPGSAMSVGIGAAGTGGTAASSGANRTGGNGAAGGAATFAGITAGGGQGGLGASGSAATVVGGTGGVAGTAAASYFDVTTRVTGNGGRGANFASNGASGAAAVVGSNGSFLSTDGFPFGITPTASSGSAGTVGANSGAFDGAKGTAGVGGASGWQGGGGGGGEGQSISGFPALNGAAGAYGGGGGGAGAYTTGGFVSGGNGGAAGTTSCAGGGGGGGVRTGSNSSGSSGAGGAGGSGSFVTIVYVA